MPVKVGSEDDLICMVPLHTTTINVSIMYVHVFAPRLRWQIFGFFFMDQLVIQTFVAFAGSPFWTTATCGYGT